jgi:hypothetical protein
VDTSGFYVGYTPDKLPSANQLIGSLNTPQNSVDVKIDISSFSSAAAQVRVSGSAGFNIPIAGILGISVGGSAAYDLSRYASSSTNITIELNYPGVTLFASMPSVLSTDNSQGWYANDILQELVARSGEDATGYRLQGSEFDVSQLFGAGCAFSRLKTFVISQQPTMTLTFTGADASRVTSDFKANASISVDRVEDRVGDRDVRPAEAERDDPSPAAGCLRVGRRGVLSTQQHLTQPGSLRRCVTSGGFCPRTRSSCRCSAARCEPPAKRWAWC